MLTDYINGSNSVPWDDLRYIFGQIMYGGHITDAWDRRTNNTYLMVRWVVQGCAVRLGAVLRVCRHLNERPVA